MKKLIIIVTGGIFLITGTFAFAIQITNPKVKVKLSEAGIYNGVIEVRNPSEEPVAVRVYLEDFFYIPPFSGDKKFLPPGSTEFSISSMINYFPQEFTVAPLSSQKVNFTIENKDNSASSRCGVLFFEMGLGIGISEGKKVGVLTRLGSLIVVDMFEGKKEGRFADIKGDLYKISGIFSNLGSAFLHVNGIFYVIDEEGIVGDRGQIEDKYLLPGNKTEIEIGVKEGLPSKNYTMVVTFDLEDGEAVIKEIDFYLSSSGEVKVLDIRD